MKPTKKALYLRKWRKKNRKKLQEQRARWRKKHARKHSDLVRKSKLFTQYGLTLELFEKILLDQNGSCAICNRKPTKIRLHVDHCHITKKVRGLLCYRCNVGIGFFLDQPNLLRLAADYLEKNK